MIFTPQSILATNLALPSIQGKPGQYYVIVFAPDSQQWNLSSKAGFVTVLSPDTQPGSTIWGLQVATNLQSQRKGSLQLQGPGKDVVIPVIQAGGDWVQDQVTQVLSPPGTTTRSKFPLAMELGAAGKFIGEQIKKLPLPAKLIALAVVVVVVIGLGVTVIAVRAGFSTVPEPPNYFTGAIVPITVELITQQTAWLASYIVQQALA